MNLSSGATVFFDEGMEGSAKELVSGQAGVALCAIGSTAAPTGLTQVGCSYRW